MKRSLYSSLVLSAVMAALLSACAGTAMKSEPNPSLYQRLGGKPAIEAVVDDFVGNVAADRRINGFFAHADIGHLKRMLVDQLCAGTGGPCTYTGRDMRTAHAGMGVLDADFNALVEDLIKSLDKFKVPAREQKELLGALGPMKKDIVGM